VVEGSRQSGITLVTGGSRSGKSSYALALASGRGGTRLFVATCPPMDDEMKARIARHREERKGGGWDTLESPLLSGADLEIASGYGVVLVDCLALWVNNIMYEAEKGGTGLDEAGMAEMAGKLVSILAAFPGRVVLVTNEVGMGIIPDNAASRLFRDLLGRCNQVVAAGADTVIFMSCGIPLVLKGEQS